MRRRGHDVGLPPVRVFSQVSARIPAELARRLKGFSVPSGQSINATVTAALQRYLEAEEWAAGGIRRAG